MVAYELSLLVRNLSRPKLVSTVKRTAESIISNGGYIEKIEYLGTRELPIKLAIHDRVHKKGSYFTIQYHIPFDAIDEIKDFCKRDLDVIRPIHIKRVIPAEIKCLLDDEIKPPAYRSEVELMIKEAKERQPKNLKRRQEIKDEVMNYPF